MKDLHSRNVLVVLFACGLLLGTTPLEGRPQGHFRSSSLGATTMTLDFGAVTIGENAVQTTYLYNPTGSDVVISGATASNSDFKIVQPSLPMTVSARQGTRLVVSFAPHTTGAATASIAIASSAQDPSLVLAALAQAVPAGGKLSSSPSSINFGNVAMGASQTRQSVLTNTTAGPVTILQVTPSSGDFSVSGVSLPITLDPNESATFRVQFSPKAKGTRGGNVTLSGYWGSRHRSRNSNGMTLPISVAGVGTTSTPTSTEQGELAVPGSLAFGSLTTTSGNQTKTLVVSNSGQASVTITRAAASGTGFTMSGPSLPVTLPALGSASFAVVFSPNTAGAASGSVQIVSNAENSNVSVALSATVNAAGQLMVNSSALSFGKVMVGSTEKQTATITNAGGTTVTVKQATVSGTAFSVSPLTMPMTLAPKQSASLSVSCTPKTSGTLTGNLMISSDAPSGSLAVPLSATAVTGGSLGASAASLNFGSVTVDASKSLPETITNNGGSSVTLSQIVAGAGFSVTGLSLPVTLNAGQSASFNVVFAPQTTGSSNVNLAVINDSETSPFSISLSGSAVGGGSVTTSSVSFGSVQVGTTSSKTATITNSGGSSVTISQANLTGTDFKMTGLNTPLTLNAGQTFTFNVNFTPDASGSASGSISLVSSAATPAAPIGLSGSGTATGALSISPNSFAFGSVNVGSSKSLPVTLTASGSSVTVTSASVTSSEFDLKGPSLPLTLQTGATASFTLTFTPQSSGAATANVSFATSASSTPVTEALSGTGASTAQHSVELAWTASRSSVTGYNVYRGSKTGGPYARLNSSGNDGVTFTDSSVQGGQTYFYTTTAVSDDGTESAFSNEVTAVVPTP